MSSSTKTAPTLPVPTQYQAGAYQTENWTEPIPTNWNTIGSAVCPMGTNKVGWYLVIANGFGFSISSDSTISGIVAEISCRGGGGAIYDSEIVLVKAGTLGTTNRADAGAWNSGSFAYKSHGGATDLWGTSWTPAQVNASDFGVAVSPKSIGGSGDAEVNGVRITVYYTTSSVKTVNGLARASVKTKNFLDIVNIKTWNGLN